MTSFSMSLRTSKHSAGEDPRPPDKVARGPSLPDSSQSDVRPSFNEGVAGGDTDVDSQVINIPYEEDLVTGPSSRASASADLSRGAGATTVSPRGDSELREDTSMDVEFYEHVDDEFISVVSQVEHPAPVGGDANVGTQEPSMTQASILRKNLEKSKKNKKEKTEKKNPIDLQATNIAQHFFKNTPPRGFRDRCEPVVFTHPDEDSTTPDEETLKVQHLQYLLDQVLDGYDGKGSSARQQGIKRVAFNASSGEQLIQYLNLFPGNDNTYRMAIENSNGIDSETMEHSLRLFAFRNLNRTKDDFRSLVAESYSIYQLFEGYANEAMQETDAEKREALVRRAANAFATLHDIKLQKTECLKTAIAWTLTRNARIIRNRIHFTNAKVPSVLRWISSELDMGVTIEEDCFTPDDIVQTISSLLSDEDIPICPDEYNFFTVVENPYVAHHFLWAEIAYDSHLDNPMRHFQRFFLSEGDKIIDWDHLESVTPSRKRATVAIYLASSKTPPTKEIEDRLYHNRKQVWSSAPEGRASKAWRALTQVINDPSIQQEYENIDSMVTSFSDKWSPSEATSPAHPYRKFPSPANMECRTLYVYRECHFCRTTEHSYSECTKRICPLCKDKNSRHRPGNCHARCPCRRGHPHLPEDCENGFRPVVRKRGADFPVLQKPPSDWQTQTRRGHRANSPRAASPTPAARPPNQPTQQRAWQQSIQVLSALGDTELEISNSAPPHPVEDVPTQGPEEQAHPIISQHSAAPAEGTMGHQPTTNTPLQPAIQAEAPEDPTSDRSWRPSDHEDETSDEDMDRSENSLNNSMRSPTPDSQPTQVDPNAEQVLASNEPQESMSSIGSFQTPHGTMIHSNHPHQGSEQIPQSPSTTDHMGESSSVAHPPGRPNTPSRSDRVITTPKGSPAATRLARVDSSLGSTAISGNNNISKPKRTPGKHKGLHPSPIPDISREPRDEDPSFSVPPLAVPTNPSGSFATDTQPDLHQ
ncbi:hypothetical protein SBP28_004526 [Candidozyma auris]